MKISTFLLTGLCILSSLFVVTTVKAQAGGPPMLTDDSGTPEVGKWENNFAFIFDGSKEEYTLEGPVLDLNYGFRDNIQLKIEMPWVKEKGQPLANKLDNVTFGVKYRFLEDSDVVSASFYPQSIISFNSAADDGRSLHYGFFLPIAVGTTFNGFGINGQLGYEWLARTKHWVYGANLSREFGERVVLILELHGEVEEIKEDEAFLNAGNFINLGAQIKLTEMFTLLAAVGKGITHSETGRQYYAYAGLQLNM